MCQGFPDISLNFQENSPLILPAADGKVEVLNHSRFELRSLMSNGEHQDEWIKLCEQAAVEQDPEKLMALTREICRLLDEREKVLKSERRP